MAVATNSVFSHTDALVEIWDAGAATPARTLLENNGRYGITLTDTVGVTKPARTIYGSVQISGITQPGVGNDKAAAIGTYAVGVAVDGTWEFEGVTGADADTAQGTPVYVDPTAGTLSVTDDGVDDVLLGYVNYPASYNRAATPTRLPIKIGA